jgi:hypothetical protein
VKMKKILLYLVVFSISLSLAAAVTITTDKTDYSSGDTVTITITECTANSILRVIDSGDRLVDIKSGDDNWDTTYNTQSSSADGVYTIKVSCTNDAAEKEFCVDDNGCVEGGGGNAVAGGDDNDGDSGRDDGSRNVGSDGGSYSGGGHLIKIRNTSDNSSELISGSENGLVGSTQCPSNSQLISGKCVCDEGLRMSGTRCVQQGQLGNRDGQQDGGTSSASKTSSTSEASAGFSFTQLWEDYTLYFIAVPSAIVLIILAFFITKLFMNRSQKFAYKPHELREWVQHERAAGSSNEEIVEVLEDHTGWKKEKILHTFPSLVGSPSAVQHTSVTQPAAEQKKI